MFALLSDHIIIIIADAGYICTFAFLFFSLVPDSATRLSPHTSPALRRVTGFHNSGDVSVRPSFLSARLPLFCFSVLSFLYVGMVTGYRLVGWL